MELTLFAQTRWFPNRRENAIPHFFLIDHVAITKILLVFRFRKPKIEIMIYLKRRTARSIRKKIYDRNGKEVHQ